MHLIDHVYHEECGNERCPVCSGGLSLCVVCNGAEGELLSYCPGYRLNSGTLDDIYKRKVIDIRLWSIINRGVDILVQNS